MVGQESRCCAGGREALSKLKYQAWMCRKFWRGKSVPGANIMLG